MEEDALMTVRIHRFALPLAALALAWSAPVHAQNDLQSTLTGIEQSLWEAWKTADFEVFRANLTENAVTTGSMGVMAGRDRMIEMMSQSPCDVTSYALSEIQLHRVSDDTAILTYRAEQDATCSGETLPSPVWVSSVYHNQGGAWRSVLYQETPAG
jgi:hypothetical protein